MIFNINSTRGHTGSLLVLTIDSIYVMKKVVSSDILSVESLLVFSS